MAKRIAKKANAVKSSRKPAITKSVKTKTAKKISPTVAKKAILSSSSHKPMKKKAADPKKAILIKAKNNIKKPVKITTTKIKAKKDSVTNKKPPVMKSIKNKVKSMKKSIVFIPEQKTISKKEDYMNPQSQNHFRMILLEWKKQLLGEMERTVHHMQDEAANFPDPNDRATQEEEFSLELRARDRERKLIKKIDEALSRLDNHDYGYCEACGVEIGEQRLSARPTATLCIDCKTIDEIREKHFS